jgi:hypothetical protein
LSVLVLELVLAGSGAGGATGAGRRERCAGHRPGGRSLGGDDRLHPVGWAALALLISGPDSARAAFEPRRGEAPASRHVVRKPGHANRAGRRLGSQRTGTSQLYDLTLPTGQARSAYSQLSIRRISRADSGHAATTRIVSLLRRSAKCRDQLRGAR